MRTKDLSTCFFLRNSIYSPAQQTKIKGTGKRNTNIEILRILLMLMSVSCILQFMDMVTSHIIHIL